MWKKHKSDRFAERGVGKGLFAECSWTLLSATLGTNFPSSGVPSFAERSCKELSAKESFFKK
jgi:hypothetical protein